MDNAGRRPDRVGEDGTGNTRSVARRRCDRRHRRADAEGLPVYDTGYVEQLTVVRQFLGSLENLQLVGRNGMHKYNNQDHSMYTAMLAVRNILGGQYDLWRVNVDQEYHEEGARLESTQPGVPERIGAPHNERRSYVGGTTKLE